MKGNILITIGISALISISCLMAFWLNQPKIGVVDANLAIKRAAIALSKTNLSHKMQSSIMKHYASKLDSTIKAYGESKGILIISSSILSSGTYDITNEIVRIGLKNEVKHV